MHPDNAFYGHNRVLSEYAGLGSVAPPIRGHLQHGWSWGTGLSAAPRLVSWLPKFVYNGTNLSAARDTGIRGATAVGAPFCYLAASAGAAELPAPERSTIAYPSHGWERGDVQGSHHRLVHALTERETGPVTVCLYWREFDQPEIRRVYEAAGFRVISHGYRHDSHFIVRLYDELQRHDRVVTNRVATALWYGALLQREVEVYGPVFSIHGPDEAEAWDKTQRSHWPELFSGGIAGAKAHELGASELGAGYLRDPEALRQLLGWTPERFRTSNIARAAVLGEHHARRLVHNLRLSLPRAEPLAR